MNRLQTTTLWLATLAVVPIAAQAKTFAEIVNGSIVPLGDKIIELFYILAFIFFLIGMVRYFFSYNPETRKQAKYFAIYSLAALVILFVIWGIIRFLIGIISSFNT